jgi:transcriptional regulator GlxA family with amidase domain
MMDMDTIATRAPLRAGALIFPGFEVLDLFGPVELLAQTPGILAVTLVAASSGEVRSAQGVRVVADADFTAPDNFDILLVPGGTGTRTQAGNAVLLEWLRRAAESSTHVAAVCTGSALLARTGLLDGRRATSNKIALDWVVSQGPRVHWVRRARWVEDGKFFTSSGVSAGMDMTLALITRLFGSAAATEAARRAEYVGNPDADDDPFAGSV